MDSEVPIPMSIEVQLARLEEKHDAQTAMMREFIDAQKVLNINFANTSMKVEKAEAKAGGVLLVLGALAAIISTGVTWVVTALRS